MTNGQKTLFTMMTLGLSSTIVLGVASCTDDNVQEKIDSTIETVKDNNNLDKIQTIDINKSFIITKSGLKLSNQKINSDIVGSSTGICLRLDNEKLPYRSLSKVANWTDNINLQAEVLLDNHETILLTNSRAGLIATSTEDSIKPDDYINICLSNHQTDFSLIGQHVKEITISADERVYIENIQWGSS